MQAYLWAQNQVKLNRAVAWAAEQERAGGAKSTEAVIKARYVELGGALNEVEEDEEEVTLESLSGAELKARAANLEIDVTGFTTKRQYIDAIRAAEDEAE